MKDFFPKSCFFLALYGLWGFGGFMAVGGLELLLGGFGIVLAILLEAAEIGLTVTVVNEHRNKRVPKGVLWCATFFALCLMVVSGSEQCVFLEKSLTKNLGEVYTVESEILALNQKRQKKQMLLNKKYASVDMMEPTMGTGRRRVVNALNIPALEDDIKQIDDELFTASKKMTLMEKQKGGKRFFSESVQLRIFIVVLIKMVQLFIIILKSYIYQGDPKVKTTKQAKKAHKKPIRQQPAKPKKPAILPEERAGEIPLYLSPEIREAVAMKIVEEKGYTPEDLAEHMNRSVKTAEQFLKGKKSISLRAFENLGRVALGSIGDLRDFVRSTSKTKTIHKLNRSQKAELLNYSNLMEGAKKASLNIL